MGGKGNREYTPYQQRLIRDHYQNRQAIRLQQLQEAASALYLGPSARQRERLWTKVARLLEGLEVPAKRRAHVLESRSPEALAAIIQELF